MHQSIPPVPIPPGQPRGIFSDSLSRGQGLCAPRGRSPGNLIQEVSKPSKAWAVKMRALFLRDGGFCGKRYGFHVTVASPRKTKQAC